MNSDPDYFYSSIEDNNDRSPRALSLREAVVLFSVLHLGDPDFVPDDAWTEICLPV